MPKRRTLAEVRLAGRVRLRKAGVPEAPRTTGEPPAPRTKLRLREDVSPAASIRCLALPPPVEGRLVAMGVERLSDLVAAVAADELGWIVDQRDEATVRRAVSWYLVPDEGEGGR